MHWEKFVYYIHYYILPTYLLLHSWIASCVYYYVEGAFEVFWPYEGPAPHYIYDAAAVALLGLVFVVAVMMVFAPAIHKTNPKEGYNFGENQIKCWDILGVLLFKKHVMYVISTVQKSISDHLKIDKISSIRWSGGKCALIYPRQLSYTYHHELK